MLLYHFTLLLAAIAKEAGMALKHQPPTHMFERRTVLYYCSPPSAPGLPQVHSFSETIRNCTPTILLHAFLEMYGLARDCDALLVWLIVQEVLS